MKKSFAAWAVLLAITLIASLALGLTNAVTKDTIAEQEKQKAEIVRQKLVTEAEAFKLLEAPEASGTPRILEIHEGAKGEEAAAEKNKKPPFRSGSVNPKKQRFLFRDEIRLIQQRKR